MNVKFIAETPQGTEPISLAIPLIQSMFRQGVQDMLYLVAVAFMLEKEISEYDFLDWFYQSLERTFLAEIFA